MFISTVRVILSLYFCFILIFIHLTSCCQVLFLCLLDFFFCLLYSKLLIWVTTFPEKKKKVSSSPPTSRWSCDLLSGSKYQKMKYFRWAKAGISFTDKIKQKPGRCSSPLSLVALSFPEESVSPGLALTAAPRLVATASWRLQLLEHQRHSWGRNHVRDLRMEIKLQFYH